MTAIKVTVPPAAPGTAAGPTYLVYDASGQRISFIPGVTVAGSKTIIIMNHKGEQVMLTQQNVTDMLTPLTTFSTTGVVT